ncbi:hypothetical protein G6F59_014749 [Rhizopus arrhizus]|nr:hypothetical protein G6F59_014749 [Rhizopus arrhizus]
MVLEDGSFHADPHPGNIIYLRDGRIGVIDFGMVGALSEVRRFQVAQLLHGLVEQDPQSVADVLLDWAVRRPVPRCAVEGPAHRADAWRHHPAAAQLQPAPAARPGADDQGVPDPGRHGPPAGSGFRHGQRRAPIPGAGGVAALCAKGAAQARPAQPAGPGRFRR